MIWFVFWYDIFYEWLRLKAGKLNALFTNNKQANQEILVEPAYMLVQQIDIYLDREREREGERERVI